MWFPFPSLFFLFIIISILYILFVPYVMKVIISRRSQWWLAQRCVYFSKLTQFTDTLLQQSQMYMCISTVISCSGLTVYLWFQQTKANNMRFHQLYISVHLCHFSLIVIVVIFHLKFKYIAHPSFFIFFSWVLIMHYTIQRAMALSLCSSSFSVCK